MFIENMLSDLASPVRLVNALIAMALVCGIGLLTGPVSGQANPVLWRVYDGLLGGVARRTYNVKRSGASLAFRGGFFTVLYAVLAGALTLVAEWGIHHLQAGGVIEPVLLALALTGGAVWSALLNLYRALGRGAKLGRGSYFPIAVSTHSDLNTTDDFGITRVGIGYMAVAYDKGLVAPVFWYLVLGLPGAWVYAGLAAARWGLSKDGFDKGMGVLALRLEGLMGRIPHLLSGVLLMLAALFTPTARLTRVMAGFFSRKGAAPYTQGGLVVTATAWALDVALGGPVQDLDGSVLKRDWVGPQNATARLDRAHLRRAIYLSVMGYVMLASLLVALLFVWHITDILYRF